MQIPLGDLGKLGFGGPAVAGRSAFAPRAVPSPFSPVHRARLNALGAVPRADAVALATELASARRELAAAQAKVQELLAAFTRLSRRAPVSRPGQATSPPKPSQGRRAAAQAAAPAPVAAAQAVVDVSPAGTVAGYESAPEPEPESAPVSATDRAWFGDHLQGSEPADFGGDGDFGDLDADLGLEGA